MIISIWSAASHRRFRFDFWTARESEIKTKAAMTRRTPNGNLPLTGSVRAGGAASNNEEERAMSFSSSRTARPGFWCALAFAAVVGVTVTGAEKPADPQPARPAHAFAF